MDRVSEATGDRTTRGFLRPLVARSTDEEHRVSTPLELFFDLCFVVAVAQASTSLHHALAEDDLHQAVFGYPIAFFSIWWAWMNFTWFSSAYDNDDLLYRVGVFVQIVGVLILAAGVPRAFAGSFAVVTLGYAVMRVGLVFLWLRAARDDSVRRRTDLHYAIGISACMVGWGLLLVIPDGVRLPGIVVMVVAELLVPVWAEQSTPTSWHAHHIAERFGLFTLIVLGESVAAATIAIQSAADAGGALGDLVDVAAGGVLVVFAMWWVYFAQPVDAIVERAREALDESSWRHSFIWGYGHYVVFASAAAVGAGLAVAADQAIGHADLSARGATLCVAIPAALYVLSVWGVHVSAKPAGPVRVAPPCAAALVVVVALAGLPVVVVGLVLVALVAFSELAARGR
jgi:low temperature requirement protein LtrA